ncbi:hypothetical protein SKAU_G00272510 [Synaphobranchus kaupii]|uniref:Uncharacterized protein n=1 Tax=Synaphobranchus kaupii TaxID=118154 RepID=A0A9Q1IQJ0_SYNKA|nr:hypothetical protein SKAU_G00272510 [Synaphobranchus kaupii]
MQPKRSPSNGEPARPICGGAEVKKIKAFPPEVERTAAATACVKLVRPDMTPASVSRELNGSCCICGKARFFEYAHVRVCIHTHPPWTDTKTQQGKEFLPMRRQEQSA